MELEKETLYHIYTRGNNRDKVFFSNENYEYFIRKINTHISKHINLIAYCLMPNHFHLLAFVPEVFDDFKFQNQYAIMLSSYTRGVNRQQSRSGSLFKKRSSFKAVPNLEYAQTCFLYIHQNPLRAGLENNLGDWQYSSFSEYSSSKTTICNLNFGRNLLQLPDNQIVFSELSNRTIPEHLISNLKESF